MSKEFYNKLYSQNNNLAWNDAPGKKVILDMYFDLLRDDKMNILDIGGGNGYFMNELLKVKKSNNYFSCDISKVACDEGKKLYKTIKFEDMDAQKLKYDDKSFDCVVSYGVFEHINDPLIAIKELRRVLKDTGVFLFMIPSLEYYRDDRDDEGWYADLNEPPQMQWNYNRTTWEKYFSDAGLKLQEIDFSQKYGALKAGVFFVGRKKEVSI